MHINKSQVGARVGGSSYASTATFGAGIDG